MHPFRFTHRYYERTILRTHLDKHVRDSRQHRSWSGNCYTDRWRHCNGFPLSFNNLHHDGNR
jgi:hypothetical protein